MKNTNTWYWIITGIFSAFMLFSSIPDIIMVPDAIKFMNHLGYPNYFIPFIGIMKVLGIIAILVPGYPRIKEWAYAGLAFDLIGATYSVVAVEGFQASTLFILLPLGFLVMSYQLHHKRIFVKD